MGTRILQSAKRQFVGGLQYIRTNFLAVEFSGNFCNSAVVAQRVSHWAFLPVGPMSFPSQKKRVIRYFVTECLRVQINRPDTRLRPVSSSRRVRLVGGITPPALAFSTFAYSARGKSQSPAQR
jgi:hypothetical protein